MAKPTTNVYFAFNLSQSVVFDWQDVTSYVRSVSISRGISRELDDYSAGSASIVLSNRTRAFDPTNTSSPFYGLIQPAGAVKVVTAGVIVYQGFIDAWQFGYDGFGVDATATVSASDALGLLAKIELDDTDFVAETTGSRIRSVLYSPSISWVFPPRLGNGTKTLDADTVVAGTNALTYLQQVARNEPGDLFAAKDGTLVFADNAWVNQSPTTVVRTNLVKNPRPSNTVIAYDWQSGTYSNTYAYLGSHSIRNTTTSGNVSIQVSMNINLPYVASFYVKQQGSAFILDSSTYIERTASGTGAISVVQVESFVHTIPAGTGWYRISFPPKSYPTAFNGSLSYWISMQPRVPQYIYVGGALIEQTSLLQPYFDGSSSYVAPENLTYAFSWNGPTNNGLSTWTINAISDIDYSEITYFSDTSGTAIKVQDIGVSLNSENLFNDISVSGYSYGSAVDSTNQNIYGIRSYSFDGALVTTDAEAQEIADYWLAIYKDPEFRADSMQLQLNGYSGATQGTVLGLDLRSQVGLYFTPIGGGSAIDKLYSVIGISHEIDTEKHTMNFVLSSLENQPFRLDNALFGVLNSDRLA